MTTINCYLILEEEHNFQERIRLLFGTNLAHLRTYPLYKEGMMEIVQRNSTRARARRIKEEWNSIETIRGIFLHF